MRRRIKEKSISIIHTIRKCSGFTLIELTVAIILLSILVALASSIYSNYINKAKVAIAESALDTTRDNLEIYNMDNLKYPDSIDFIDCIDEKNRVVFSPTFCKQLKNDLDSIESYIYASEDNSYVLKARAKDVKNTLITTNSIKLTK